MLSGGTRAAAITTLLRLCRLNRLFYTEATPYLYRNVSVALPTSFESFVGTVGVIARDAAADEGIGQTGWKLKCEEKDGLLTPPPSRDSSRERPQCKFRFYHITSMLNIVVQTDSETGFFLPVSLTEASSKSAVTQFARPWRADNPGLYIHTITFERFRSHGLSRTLLEGSREKFVTPERVLQILRSTRLAGDSINCEIVPVRRSDEARNGNLRAVGFTEYVDVSKMSIMRM